MANDNDQIEQPNITTTEKPDIVTQDETTEIKPQPKPQPKADLSSDIVNTKISGHIKKLETRLATMEDKNISLAETIKGYEEQFKALRGVTTSSGQPVLQALEEMFSIKLPFTITKKG